MKDNELKYWVALSSVEGVGPVAFKALLAAFGSPKQVFSAPFSLLRAIAGIGAKTAGRIKDFNDWKKVHQELDDARRAGIVILTSTDPLYPKPLLNIYDNPACLFVKGSLHENDINIAFVGSRMASQHGLFTTERLCRELALKGITIVSGLARGIDSAAHRGALAGRGRTIAVLGCGLDIIYPPENEKLLNDIAANGAVLSEFPLGTPPNAPNFPARNRIISGLSLGVVVVEAGEKSGSLITARIALEQGRDVFAVPGSIDVSGSRGTNKLIKQGAKLVQSIDDILDEILPQVGMQSEALKTGPADPAACRIGRQSATANGTLTERERALWQKMPSGPIPVDEIIASTEWTTADVLSTLLSLELKGAIEQKPGKIYVRKES